MNSFLKLCHVFWNSLYNARWNAGNKGIYQNSVSNKDSILRCKETTHPFHHFNPLAMALLIVPYCAQIMLDTNYITNSKCVDLGKWPRMEGPAVVTAFILHTNVSSLSYSMNYSHLSNVLQKIRTLHVTLAFAIETVPMSRHTLQLTSLGWMRMVTAIVTKTQEQLRYIIEPNPER